MVRRMTSASRPWHRKLPDLAPDLVAEAEAAAGLVLAPFDPSDYDDGSPRP